MRRCLPLLLLSILLAPAARADVTYTDNTHHFTIVYPSGWYSMPQTELDAINAKTTTLRFVAGGRAIGATTPYCMVEFKPRTGRHITVAEFQRYLDDATPHGKASYDAANNRLVFESRVNTSFGQRDAIVYGFAGTSDLVLVFCYSRPEQTASLRRQFAGIADSFAFQPGYAGEPGAISPTPFGTTSRGVMIIGAVGLAVLAGGVVLLLVLLRKPKPAYAPPQAFGPPQAHGLPQYGPPPGYPPAPGYPSYPPQPPYPPYR